jgi:predicted nucleic acid-binding protein
MMKVIIDTNVIIDYLADRNPFADDAERIIDLCGSGELVGLITANAVTDIYYILRKQVGHQQTIKYLQMLFSVMGIADVGKNDLLRAMELDMPDFEDALVSQCAKHVKAEQIVTRNIQDFLRSPVPAITPEDFLHQFFPV